MLYVGVDLGGTNIAVGIVNEEGNIIEEGSTPTLVGRPFSVIVKDMAQCILSTIKKAGVTLNEIENIGVGIPGVGDQNTGDVIFCTNLGWTNEPLRRELQKHIDKPMYLDNDATVAGLAESVAGVSAGCASSVFLTLGTGVGGGIILGGKPWSGHHGVGSEIGHVTLEIDGEMCTCGKRGCLERYCSATAIIRMGRQAIIMNPHSMMNEMSHFDPNQVTGRIVIDAAKQGDEVAMQVFRRYVKYLALGISSIICFLDPQMIVLGGGISKAGNFLLDPLKLEVDRYAMYKGIKTADIQIARLGSNAGIIGAAMLGSRISE